MSCINVNVRREKAYDARKITMVRFRRNNVLSVRQLVVTAIGIIGGVGQQVPSTGFANSTYLQCVHL